MKRMEDVASLNSNPMNKQECLNLLRKELLGEDYCITDSIGVDQANEIITYEIIRRYKHKLEWSSLYEGPYKSITK